MTSLIRQTFKTSRLAEFCSEKELINQTGHAVADWPLVILKELLDNALDGAEEAGVAPVIGIAVDDNGITVADNGPGMDERTVEAAFGYRPKKPGRHIITGINWFVAIGDPFRVLGAGGDSLGAILTSQRAGPQEPIVCPRIEYLDRGKSNVAPCRARR